MKRSQITKTFDEKESDGIVTFIDENDRYTFCHLLSNLIESEAFKKRIAKRVARNKSFTIKCKIPEFAKINLVQKFSIKFKKVRGISHEFDLDVKVERTKNIPIEEIFDVTV